MRVMHSLSPQCGERVGVRGVAQCLPELRVREGCPLRLPVCLAPHPESSLALRLRPLHAMRGEVKNPHSILVSSSSACSISSSLTTTVRRGTSKAMLEAQASESTKIAAVSGKVVTKWPPR
jgi:hypothetical protein